MELGTQNYSSKSALGQIQGNCITQPINPPSSQNHYQPLLQHQQPLSSPLTPGLQHPQPQPIPLATGLQNQMHQAHGIKPTVQIRHSNQQAQLTQSAQISHPLQTLQSSQAGQASVSYTASVSAADSLSQVASVVRSEPRSASPSSPVQAQISASQAERKSPRG